VGDPGKDHGGNGCTHGSEGLAALHLVSFVVLEGHSSIQVPAAKLKITLGHRKPLLP
jgi:hypothetical protein